MGKGSRMGGAAAERGTGWRRMMRWSWSGIDRGEGGGGGGGKGVQGNRRHEGVLLKPINCSEGGGEAFPDT